LTLCACRRRFVLDCAMKKNTHILLLPGSIQLKHNTVESADVATVTARQHKVSLVRSRFNDSTRKVGVPCPRKHVVGKRALLPVQNGLHSRHNILRVNTAAQWTRSNLAIPTHGLPAKAERVGHALVPVMPKASRPCVGIDAVLSSNACCPATQIGLCNEGAPGSCASMQVTCQLVTRCAITAGCQSKL